MIRKSSNSFWYGDVIRQMWKQMDKRKPTLSFFSFIVFVKISGFLTEEFRFVFFFFFLEGTLGDSCHAWSFLEVFFSQSYHKCISPAINTDRSIRPNPMHGHQDHKSILVRDIMRRNKSRGCCRSLWSHCIKIHENMTFTLSALVVIFSMDQNNGRFFSMALWHCRFILAELNRLIPNWYQVPKDWNFIKKTTWRSQDGTGAHGPVQPISLFLVYWF